MHSKASLLTLIQELEGDMRELDRAAAQNARAWARIQGGATDSLDWGALGFTIHSAYGVIENYCLRISKQFENNLDRDSWHKALIERMALEIPEIRPAFLSSEDLKNNVIEILRFRHRFRNLYGEELDPGKTSEVQRKFMDLVPRLKEAHKAFAQKLQAIAELL